MDDRPEYEWLRELVRARGDELRARHGAHSIGVGRKVVDGRRIDQLAVIFYVDDKGAGGEPIPATISFTPAGQAGPVTLCTDVVETPRTDPAG
ncbi:MAG: hypothetical protein ACRDZ2_09570 [Ilumatobacteraceae bacterium]